MRQVTISTVSFLLPEPGKATTRDANIERALNYLDIAGRRGSDIVCLPETFPEMAVAKADPLQYAEPVPGPLTEIIGRKAKEYGMYVICPTHTKAGNSAMYNTSILLDRSGRVVGQYHKSHPMILETTMANVIPGNELPVFQCDFGQIGITICMDIYFPEIWRVLTLKGAEVIFWSTMASGPSEGRLETIFRGRAVDYNVYMVESNYIYPPPYQPDTGRSRHGRAKICDLDGITIADTGHRDGVATATIDLDEVRLGLGCVSLPERYFADPLQPDDLRLDLLVCRRPNLYHKIVEGKDWYGVRYKLGEHVNKRQRNG